MLTLFVASETQACRAPSYPTAHRCPLAATCTV
jgi:hypothetical protein